MSRVEQSHVISVGLAIFSMLFGAGNLMYPLAVGMSSGSMTPVGIAGFLLTAICLPLIGLLAMILYDGNYDAFFGRLGPVAGKWTIFACMLIIGPIIAMPRIVTLSHTMTAPFMPFPFLQEVNLFSSFIFALIFLGVTFLGAFRESKIVDVLGNYISPALLISLTIIIIKGLLSAETVVPATLSASAAFGKNLIRGYETLDLLGTIFFCSIVLTILKEKTNGSTRKMVLTGLKGGLLGLSLLGLVYIGMSALGAYHGHGLIANAGELFSIISFRIVGCYGAAIIATAVLMACLSTSIALSAVLADYMQITIFKRSIDFVPALLLVLASCIPLSTAGIESVLKLTAGPLIYIGYPCLITLCFCNIAYKTIGFSYVRIPVIATFVLSLISYYIF